MNPTEAMARVKAGERRAVHVMMICEADSIWEEPEMTRGRLTAEWIDTLTEALIRAQDDRTALRQRTGWPKAVGPKCRPEKRAAANMLYEIDEEVRELTEQIRKLLGMRS